MIRKCGKVKMSWCLDKMAEMGYGKNEIQLKIDNGQLKMKSDSCKMQNAKCRTQNTECRMESAKLKNVNTLEQRAHLTHIIQSQYKGVP